MWASVELIEGDKPGDSRVVFITRNIPERDVRALFAAVERLAKDNA